MVQPLSEHKVTVSTVEVGSALDVGSALEVDLTDEGGTTAEVVVKVVQPSSEQEVAVSTVEEPGSAFEVG